MVLELHHIDGNRYNHKKDNLEWLCPNCHSLTSNFRGRKNWPHFFCYVSVYIFEDKEIGFLSHERKTWLNVSVYKM